MDQITYKTFFVLLILSLFSAKVEVSFAVGIIPFVMSFSSKINIKLANILFLLAVIFIVGAFGIFKLDNTFQVYIKDIVYYSRPIIVILASFFLIRIIKDKEFLFTSIITLGFIYSIIHIFKIVINVNNIASIVDIRVFGGRYNHVELIALIFIITLKDIKIRNYFTKLTFKFLVFLLIVSFLLYFSRVMFVVLVLFFMAYKGYFKLTKKGIKKIFFGTILLVIFMAIINHFKVDSNSQGIGGFVFKIQNTYDEIFESLDIENIKLDKRQLWKHWRGYEAQSAIEELNSEGLSSWVFGEGFGSTVDLGVEVDLANEKVRYIPILHNGFVYVLFKTGIFGLIVYLIYVLYLYSFYKANSRTKTEFDINRLIVGCAFYIILSSLVVTGIFKPYDLSSLLIGSLFALKQYYNENRNIRNQRSA